MAQLRRRFRFRSGEERRSARGPQDPAGGSSAATTTPTRGPDAAPSGAAETATPPDATPAGPIASTPAASPAAPSPAAPRAPETTPRTIPQTTASPAPAPADTTSGPATDPVTDPATLTATTPPTEPERPTQPRGRGSRKPATTPEKADRGEVLRQAIGVLAAAHLPLGVLVGTVVGAGVALTGRPADEAALAGLAVLVVLAATGLGNDVADVERDRETQARGKPVASDLLPAGNAAFVAICLAVVAVPLSLRHGTLAGAALLACLPVGWAYNRWLRRTALSPLPWIATSGLLLLFVSYGGPGWGLWGGPPTVEIAAAVAALAVGLHFLTSLPDLVADNRTGVRHLPLRVALRLGAPRLLLLSGLITAAAAAAVVLVALGPGLRQG